MTLNTLATILILGFAVYRISRVLPVDEIAEPLRVRIELFTYPERELSTKATARRLWLGRLASCPVCLGWWVSALAVLFYSLVVVGDWMGWAFLIFWPATAGVGAAIALVVDHDG
jgi:hypothetical protein